MRLDPACAAVNSQTAPHADLADFLAGARHAGFSAVELSGDLMSRSPDEALDQVHASGLDVVGLCPTEALYDWHWHWDDQVEADLHVQLERARSLRAPYFVLPFMRDRGDEVTVTRHLRFAEALAVEVGVGLAVEPIGHYDVLRRARQIVDVVSRCDPDVVGVLLDSFHFFRAGNVLDDLVLFDDVPVWALQISNANDLPIDELLGYRDRTFPLDGPFATERLVEWWLEQHPRRPLIVEVIGDTVASMSTEQSLALAAEHLSTLLTTHSLIPPQGDFR